MTGTAAQDGSPGSPPRPLAPAAPQGCLLRVQQLGDDAHEDQARGDEESVGHHDPDDQHDRADAQRAPGTGTPVLPWPCRAPGTQGVGETGIVLFESRFKIGQSFGVVPMHGCAFREPARPWTGPSLSISRRTVRARTAHARDPVTELIETLTVRNALG